MDKLQQEKVLANVKRLQEQYKASLAQRYEGVASHWQLVKENPANSEVQKELYRSVHSIAGSSGTFGVPEVGTAARELLNSIKDWQALLLQNTDAPPLADIENGLEHLRRVIDRNRSPE